MLIAASPLTPTDMSADAPVRMKSAESPVTLRVPELPATVPRLTFAAELSVPEPSVMVAVGVGIADGDAINDGVWA